MAMPLPRAVAATAAGLLVTSILAAGPAIAARRDTIPPTMPPNLHTTQVTETSVTLAWDRSTDNVGVQEYAAWTPGQPIVRTPPDQTTATFTSLRPNTSYHFRVQAWDGWNWSFQNELVVTTRKELVAPTAPSGLRLSDEMLGSRVDGLTASTVLLAWNSSTDDFGPISYEVLVNGVPSPDVWDFWPAGSARGPVSGAWARQLRPGTTYGLSVRARDDSGNVSAPSNTVTVTTDQSTDTSAPTTPTLLSAAIGMTGTCPDEIWTEWSASGDGTQPASSIDYEVRINGVILSVVTGATRQIDYTDVLGPIAVTVVAVDRAGNASAPSNAIHGATNWAPESDCGR